MIKAKTVKVISDGDLETFLEDHYDGDVRDLLTEAFPECRNETYERLYGMPDAICPSPLDPYKPALRAALDLGVGEHEYVLVHFSW